MRSRLLTAVVVTLTALSVAVPAQGAAAPNRNVVLATRVVARWVPNARLFCTAVQSPIMMDLVSQNLTTGQIASLVAVEEQMTLRVPNKSVHAVFARIVIAEAGLESDRHGAAVINLGQNLGTVKSLAAKDPLVRAYVSAAQLLLHNHAVGTVVTRLVTDCVTG
jgi:hypothetical protein